MRAYSNDQTVELVVCAFTICFDMHGNGSVYIYIYTGADPGYKEGGSESGCVMYKAHVVGMGSGGILPQKCDIQILRPLVALQ